MSLCRTCKHWSLNPHFIGLGHCINTEVLIRANIEKGFLTTAQDFGCVLHTSGENESKLYSAEYEAKMLKEFLSDKPGYAI